MNRKGQLSFEFLLLTLVIFSLAIVIAGYHFAEQDTTNAMLIAKSETLSWLSEQDEFYYITNVNFDTATNTLTINLSGNPGNTTDLENRVKLKVENSTGLVNILVDAN
ncbi:MAG: hypothetical protein V1672_02145 [Candidatus Diapherotrites archaeon]